MTYPLIEHGGTGPILHWAPANGFPLSTYQPILDALAARFRCVTVPPRALWPAIGDPPAANGDWSELAVDLVAGIEQHGLRDVIAVGHSFGAVASLVATNLKRPLFRALILLDPVILPVDTMVRYSVAKQAKWMPDGHALARQAIGRRSRFTSRGEAFDVWRRRRLFADWSDAALMRYVEGALRPDGSGGYVLSWSAAWEAYYYLSFKTDTWREIAGLDATLPILVVAGADSDSFLPEARAEFEAMVPWAESRVVEGAGHLFPQAAPEQTLAVLSDWLSRTMGA
ncbi:MAG: alpha/beta fold hydrolase [Gemmatimonadales bacterium]